MAIRFFNPYTPGNRNRSGSDFSELTRKAPEKHLVKGQKRSHGRNNRGVITCRHKGGGHKRLYRQIDFRRGLVDIAAKVEAVEYDPNRTANLALLHYEDGTKSYILHPRGVEIGDTLISCLRPLHHVVALDSDHTPVLKAHGDAVVRDGALVREHRDACPVQLRQLRRPLVEAQHSTGG